MSRYDFGYNVELPKYLGEYISFTEERKSMEFDLYYIDKDNRLITFSDDVFVFLSKTIDENMRVSSNQEFLVNIPSSADRKVIIDFANPEDQ